MKNRKPLITASVDSVNYNLNDENSDRDYKQFVCPTFDDLYYNKQYSKSYTSEFVDYTVHDIRKLSYLLYKSNINFIELLFAQEMEFIVGLEWLKDNRDELATMNLPYLYTACVGMSIEKMKRLHKGTTTTQALVDKYGYDTKQAMCAYRVLDFLDRIINTDFNFGKAIYYSAGEDNHNVLMKMKRGEYKEEFLKLYENKKQQVDKYKESFRGKKIKEDVKEELDKVVKKVVIRNLI